MAYNNNDDDEQRTEDGMFSTQKQSPSVWTDAGLILIAFALLSFWSKGVIWFLRKTGLLIPLVVAVVFVWFCFFLGLFDREFNHKVQVFFGNRKEVVEND
jgi:hypothetical protein